MELRLEKEWFSSSFSSSSFFLADNKNDLWPVGTHRPQTTSFQLDWAFKSQKIAITVFAVFSFPKFRKQRGGRSRPVDIIIIVPASLKNRPLLPPEAEFSDIKRGMELFAVWPPSLH